jgi:Contractile injection system tube protein
MERVAFIVEATGERLGCLLNPETVVARRSAGVERRRSAGGKLTGAALTDDPLLYTGGGQTELLLDLLFDVSIGGSSIQTDDVRDLTGPLWDLAENRADGDGAARPPVVRFVWGKTWNVPGLVTAVAERLEAFNPAGAPRRSWLRMQLLRVSDADMLTRPRRNALDFTHVVPPPPDAVGDSDVAVYRVLGSGGAGGANAERLEDIAWRHYGDPSAWRLIARFNGIGDPTRVEPGTLLRLPAEAALTRAR